VFTATADVLGVGDVWVMLVVVMDIRVIDVDFMVVVAAAPRDDAEEIADTL